MKKIIALAALVAVGGGVYAHHRYWQSQSDKIKAHIEELATGGNESFKLTYDHIETAGYPFRHDVKLKNPCVYFLKAEPSLSLTEGCLKGTMLLSYHPFSTDRDILVETDGEFVFSLPPQEGKDSPSVVLRGHLKQEYSFEQGYEFRKSSDLVYFIENLKKASLEAKDVMIGTLQEPAKTFIEDFTGSFDYSRRPNDEKSQTINLSLDYSTRFGDPIQDGQPPFEALFAGISSDIKQFNINSGVNKGRYDWTLVVPTWAELKHFVANFNTIFDSNIPSFSIDGSQNSKNNFFTSKSRADISLSKEKDQTEVLKWKSDAVQDMTKEGEKEFTSLLLLFAKEALKGMASSEEEKRAFAGGALDELFQGFPRHVTFDVDVVAKRQNAGPKGGNFSLNVDSLSIGSDKGSLNVAVDFKTDEPFNAKLEFDSFARIIDGLITRYNVLARAIEHGSRLPQISENERDLFLAILQKYSDTPDKLSSRVTFTITESSNGEIMIGRQQDIRGLVGEMAFFFQHLQQKLKDK